MNCKNVLIECIRELNTNFDSNEIAFLALQGKIEQQLRDKIAWLLYQKGYRNVKKEYAPQGFGRKKCDLAILDEMQEPVCLVEFKAHSTQNWEGKYKTYFEDDVQKMRDFAAEFPHKDIPLYYVFFQTINSKQFNEDREVRLVAYCDIINRAIKSPNMSLEEQWRKMCSSEADPSLIDRCTIMAGSYLGSDVKIETMVYGPIKAK